jgi:peptidyl-prolyl cis-trans isomerase C
MAKTAAAVHILVKEEKLALDLLEQIKNGADFGKLAKKHSICPSGKRGGDLGEFRQGQMVPAFDKVVFSCPVLEPTGPLHTQFGYHIIKVLYRNDKNPGAFRHRDFLPDGGYALSGLHLLCVGRVSASATRHPI